MKIFTREVRYCPILAEPRLYNCLTNPIRPIERIRWLKILKHRLFANRYCAASRNNACITVNDNISIIFPRNQPSLVLVPRKKHFQRSVPLAHTLIFIIYTRITCYTRSIVLHVRVRIWYYIVRTLWRTLRIGSPCNNTFQIDIRRRCNRQTNH